MKPTGPFFVVVNAGSGREAAADKVSHLRTALQGTGRPFDLLIARRGRDLQRVAEAAARKASDAGGVLVVAGGDGTINAVGSLAVRQRIPFGIVPSGTFNYLSRTHGIPQTLEAAVDNLCSGVTRPVQAGLINDRIFFVNASVGLYPQLLQDREAFKRRYGRSRLVAIWSALVTLLHQGRQLEVDLDADGESTHVRTPTLFVGNNRLQMRQVGIDQDALLDQGRLIAITAEPLGISSSLKLMLQGFLGRLGRSPDISSFAFRTLTMTIGRRRRRRRVKVATDGEIGHLLTPLIFRPSPLPLLLIMPEDAVSGVDPEAG